jgi:hypothetical protein
MTARGPVNGDSLIDTSKTYSARVYEYLVGGTAPEWDERSAARLASGREAQRPSEGSE